MKEIIVEMDTRNQKDSYVTKYFDKHGIKWIRNKLYTGDVKLLNSTKVIIDLKKNLEELCGNICSVQHQRLVREIERSREIGCEDFIFLIKDSKIKKPQDIINWSSKHTKVKGDTLYKALKTFKEHHNVRYVFCNSKNAGAIIIKLLTND